MTQERQWVKDVTKDSDFIMRCVAESISVELWKVTEAYWSDNFKQQTNIIYMNRIVRID